MIKCFTLLFCVFLSANLLAQIEEGVQTDNTLGAEVLVRNVFITGDCRNVRNIRAIGNESLSIGQFSNARNALRINDGIILSTGNINLAEGPNERGGSGARFNTVSDDPNLNALATDSLFDATGIEFDFIPIENRVTFVFVFASEEYCEFVDTEFNDVFGFFVSGPGINGTFENNAINVARLPESEVEVSINTVNHLTNPTAFVNNVTNADAGNCDIAFISDNQELIGYDGFTIPLLASFRVTPCETYTISLILGDVGDDQLDSAVFLETNSFDLGEGISVRAEVPGSLEPNAFESCVDGQFVFSRSPISNVREDLIIEYSISSESTAINGVDFEEIPLSITIPAGQTTFTLPITLIEDNILEGPESIGLELVYECECLDPIISELIINEVSDFSTDFEDILVCANQEFGITPEIIGGVPPFQFLWDTGEVTDTFITTVTEPTQFTVTVTDFCGNSKISVADVGIQDVPNAILRGNFNLCETEITGIPVILEGNPPWTIGYSIDGIEQESIENITTTPFNLTTLTEGTYILTEFSDAFCDGNVIGSALVESPFDVTTDIVPPSCTNSFDGSIAVTQLDGDPPFTIEWSIDTEDDLFLSNLKEDTYTISITDVNNCFYERSFDLIALSTNSQDCASVYIPNSFSPNNDGVNDIFSIFAGTETTIQRINSFQVYSRLGELIFERVNFLPDNGATGWTGESKGKAVNPDVYIYKVIVAFQDGTTQQLTGDVTVLR